MSGARPHYLEPTAFHARTSPLVQGADWERWATYQMPAVFSTVEQEYFALRNNAVVHDISPMRKYLAEGPDVERFVDRLVTRRAGTIRPGQVAYAVWCNGEGQVVEDGTLFRLAPDAFQINTAEPNLAWFEDTARGLDVAIRERTREIAALSLQGPASRAILAAAGFDGIADLRLFRHRRFELAGLDVLVSRTGYTGDLGYELWLEAEGALALWDLLAEAGRLHRLEPMGSRALDIARIEAGFLLVNADFVGAEAATRHSRKRTPFELGLDWAVDLTKPFFNGRRALLAEAARGPLRRLVGLDIAGNKPAGHSYVYARKGDADEIGLVTSAAWSPTLKKNLGFALLDARHAAIGTRVIVDIYHQKELKVERIEAEATVVERRFFDPSRRRA
jgi:aminomethyltransferase